MKIIKDKLLNFLMWVVIFLVIICFVALIFSWRKDNKIKQANKAREDMIKELLEQQISVNAPDIILIAAKYRLDQQVCVDILREYTDFALKNLDQNLNKDKTLTDLISKLSEKYTVASNTIADIIWDYKLAEYIYEKEEAEDFFDWFYDD